MSRTKDLAAIARGIDLVRRAAVDVQRKECSSWWYNSSLKSAVEDGSRKVQDYFSTSSGNSQPFKVHK